LRHTCIAHVTLERDLQDEWPFVKSQVRQKVKFVSKLLLQGVDALREAGVAGCGIIRLSAWNIEDDLRSRKLVRVLPDLLGGEFEAFFVYPEELRTSKRIAVFRDFLIRKVTEVRAA